jgi:hypothetical protein
MPAKAAAIIEGLYDERTDKFTDQNQQQNQHLN